MIAQIEAMDSAGPEMDDLVAALARAVEHHVKEERDDLFPKAKALLGPQLAELGMQMKQRQGELEAQMGA
jgi:hypothetical protein